MNDKKWLLLFTIWVIALVATMGSLFFSEVMLLPPCILCWYQRLCMYPLVLMILVGLFPLDLKVVKFSLPLALVGWGIALYHNLLYYSILPQSSSPCVRGVSCTSVQIQWLGFITIPLMSLVAFTIINGLLFLLIRKAHDEK
jgi:disulfide bond formation protein DsbB